MSFFEYILLNQKEIFEKIVEHLGLTFISLAMSLVVGLLIGILLTRYKKSSDFVIGVINAIQTIPSLALLGFLLPILGIGPIPAIVALFLYALLPIVRNTFVGIDEVDKNIKEAGRGMGMSDYELLTKVELPLAVPTIFAGIRTAMVLSIGIATICALIGAGGLGELIYRGIALNNTKMILAGAIPAAILAISFDLILAVLEKHINRLIRPILLSSIVLFFMIVPFFLLPQLFEKEFTAGFVPEFMERADGYKGLVREYSIKLKTKELDSQLMFQALKDKRVDLIAGYSTEGRIKAYNFQILEDDKKLFPPYYACPVIRGEILRKYPTLRNNFSKIEGKITDEKMTEMNYEIEHEGKSPKDVARDFLLEAGFSAVGGPAFGGKPASKMHTSYKADIIIGSKNFTEQYILAEIFKQLIEVNSNLNVELKTGLAGTKFCFDALTKGEIDIYPEYTGTALFVLLKPPKQNLNSIIQNKDILYSYVKGESKKRFDVDWIGPLGFNNTWALMMREEDTKKFMIRTISDLKKYLDKKEKNI